MKEGLDINLVDFIVELEAKKNCPSCNKELRGIEKFCTECGANI